MDNLKISNLSYAYGDNQVLNGIDFEIKKASVLSVLGKNGAGKSTLFKCMLGFLSDYSGRIEIDGIDIRRISRKELAQRISYIPQAHQSAFNFSVLDVVAMGRASWISGFSIPKDSDYELAYDCLVQMGISELYARGYREISGGERQLVLIARALCQQSEVMIMDEPTSNLDYGNQIKLMKKIVDLSKKGYAIVLSTHNPEHALKYSDLIAVIDDSTLSAFGPAKEVLNGELLSKVYGVPINLVNMEIAGKPFDIIMTK